MGHIIIPEEIEDVREFTADLDCLQNQPTEVGKMRFATGTSCGRNTLRIKVKL